MIRPLIGVCWLWMGLFAGLTLQAEEPFVFEKTPGFLPKDVVPTRYDVRLTPDLEKNVFTGEEEIAVEAKSPVRKIVLHAAGLEIRSAELVRATGKSTLQPVLDAATESISLALDEPLAGPAKLRLTFAGKLTEQPRGLYIARYQVNGHPGRALATQMEPTDCRRMFPCWDEPSFRAEYALTVTVPEKLRAISNMPVSAEKPVGEGLKEVAFAPSPKMASYLVALIVGDLEELRDSVDGIQLGFYTTPGKSEQARHALEATKQVLHYYNEYFGSKYPLPKLDQVALPNTGASGMENWGCIVYNDNALLYDPATSSQDTKQWVYAVVAHEIAHQWFGDLVTMAWWDNLWLNEGFASWMGTKATDVFNPKWKMWLRAAGSKEHAMRLDARATTHPIQQPVARDADVINGFDEITYSKGQAVLRMLEGWLGEDVFRDGIRAYVAKHAYGNTTTGDLWQALERTSGKPVRAFAAGWTEQPGFPVVTVSGLARGDGTLVQFEQERFTVHQKNAAPLLWQLPVIYGPAGAPHRALSELLTMATQPGQTIEGEAAIKANIGATGYFRTAYDSVLGKRLRKAAPHLAEADRLNTLHDTWALVQAGRAPAGDFLNLAVALSDDRSPTILGEMVDVLGEIDDLQRGSPQRDGYRRWARSILQPHLDRLGWDAPPDESPLDANLRGALIRTLGYFGDPAIQKTVRERFARFVADQSTLNGDLRDPVLKIAGREADAATWDQLHDLAQKADSFEQKRMLYGALAAARDPQLAARTLALSLADELVAPDAARLVQRVANDAEQPELAWVFARQHLETLLSKVSALSANGYVSRIFEGFDDAARADELEAFSSKNLPPSAKVATAKVSDDIRFRAEFKARVLPQIDAWWQAQVGR